MEILKEAFTRGISTTLIVAIVLVIYKFFEHRKESTQVKVNKELIESINMTREFIMSITKDIIDRDKDKCKIAIEDSMYSSAMKLIHFVSSTIVNNHIVDNRISILSNIHNIVNSEFYTIFSTLSMYKTNNVPIANHLDKDWMKDIENDIIDIIYNSNLDNGDKILTFNNKLNIKFQSYIMLVTNKAFKIN